MSALHQRVTKVWLALMVLTAVTTWGLSTDLFSPAVAVTGTFLIAAVKVRFVMLDFMELRHAPIRVRIAFQSWLAVVVALILGMWLLAPNIL